MIGWRARIGSIQPSRGDTFAYEFYKMVPEGVGLAMTATNIKKLTIDEFERALSEYDKAAELLATEEVDLIMVGGSPLIALKGVGRNLSVNQLADLAAQMERAGRDNDPEASTLLIGSLSQEIEKVLRVLAACDWTDNTNPVG